jgi:C-terminal processing protease CtpA/Prc
MSVTVRKEDPKEKAGIRLGMEDNGRVRVTSIATNGLFHDSEVEVGDIVLSISGKRLHPGEGPEELMDVISKAQSKVTVVVKKPNIAPRKQVEKPVDPKDFEDNNRKSKKSYTEKAHHNADGSLKLAVGGTGKDPEVQGEQMIISAPKEYIKEDVGVVFEVQDSKLFVSEIKKTSIFQNTELAVGDRVVSINDMSFREYVDAKYALLRTSKAETSVTIVVEKEGHKSFTALPATKSQQGSKPKRSVSRDSLHSSSGGDDSSTSSCGSFGNEDNIISLKNGERKLTKAIISAPKKFVYEKVGVSMRESDGMLFVEKIAADSIFSKSSLRVGDRVISINDKSFRHSPDLKAAKLTMQKAKEAVSLVVQKGQDVFQETTFDLDASSTNLVWQ